MPRIDLKTCRHCGRHSDECGAISHTRSCADCARARLYENMDGIHLHTGPAMLRWRRSVAASVGAVLLDDLEALAR